MIRANRRLTIGLLLLTGLCLWYVFGRAGWWYPAQLIVLILQTGFALLPPVNRWLSVRLDLRRHPTMRARSITAISISTLGFLYLLLSAIQQERDFFPHLHDESMHLIQARQLADGRLWSASHALPQFFETFHVFVTPVYAAMQFPGTSMLYVPGIWLHLPYWITSLAIAGVSLGLFYRIVAEMIDGVAGILAAIMLLGVLEFRYVSVMVLSNPAALMFGLCMIRAWLRWRNRQTFRAAILIGIFAGWAAITRPPDAVCFAFPIGLAMMWNLRHRSPLDWSKCGACLLIGAAPFLGLQLIFNHGVTGEWLTSPHQLYVKTFHPGGAYGTKTSDAATRPQTNLEQKLDYYEGFVVRDTGHYRPSTAYHLWITERLPTLFKASLPSLLLLPLLPCGLPALRRRQRWILFAVFPLFIGLYSLSVFFASQYCLLNTVALIPLVILGVREIEDAIPEQRRRIETITAVALVALSFTQLPQFNPGVTEQYGSKTLLAVEDKLSGIAGRAVVFFRYRHGANVHEEPVYNIGAADIDSQRIVRAQDLGRTENLKLIRYYAERQPDRRAYLFDRADRTLTPLGPVAKLAVTGDVRPETIEVRQK